MTQPELSHSVIAAYSRAEYKHFAAEYRETHEVVTDAGSALIVADNDGHEYNEWAEDIDAEWEAISEWHHRMAENALLDYDWTGSYPVVLLKDTWNINE